MSQQSLKALEVLEGTEAGSALREMLWKHRRQWGASLVGHPAAVSPDERTYAAGAAAALETLYDEIARLIRWRVPAEAAPTDPRNQGLNAAK